jgi:hypothetical protein
LHDGTDVGPSSNQVLIATHPHRVGRDRAYKLGGFHISYLDENGTRQLLKIIGRKQAPKALDAALEWLPLPRACRIAQAPYAAVISAALAGDIRTCRLEEDGLASVGVLLQQVRQYTLKRRYRSAAKR